MLGDSISAGYGIQREQGWVNLLMQTLEQEESGWHAVNASISGETTGGGLARLPGLLDTHEPGIVVIELGGNDGLRGYPVKAIESNLSRMVDLVQARDSIPVVVAMRIPPNYGPRYANAFDAVFGKVAEEKGAQFVPFIMEQVALEDGLMQDDGIHPTAEAQPLLLNVVWPVLQSLISLSTE